MIINSILQNNPEISFMQIVSNLQYCHIKTNTEMLWNSLQLLHKCLRASKKHPPSSFVLLSPEVDIYPPVPLKELEIIYLVRKI